MHQREALTLPSRKVLYVLIFVAVEPKAVALCMGGKGQE